MTALRDRFAHGYASVDFERIWAELPQGTDALDRFATEMAKQIDPDAELD